MTYELTRTQQRIYDALSDGKPHSTDDLRQYLYYEQSSKANLRTHIWGIRKKIRPERDILVQYIQQALHYRMVASLEQSAS